MKNRITHETAAEYQSLADHARRIQSELDALKLAVMRAGIPEDAKIKTFDWIDRTETFRGLAYFLTPQTEWTGGDSLDAGNPVMLNPHIAR